LPVLRLFVLVLLLVLGRLVVLVLGRLVVLVLLLVLRRLVVLVLVLGRLVVLVLLLLLLLLFVLVFVLLLLVTDGKRYPTTQAKSSAAGVTSHRHSGPDSRTLSP
jgi:hypothetical protein